MNLCFYGAIARLPLGVVVTVEFLGPLGLSAAVSRRPIDFVAVVAALAGVVAVSACSARSSIISTPSGSRWPSRRVGAGQATSWPIAPWDDGGADWMGSRWPWRWQRSRSRRSPRWPCQVPGSAPCHLAVGGLVAVLSSVLPYSLELVALRRIDTRVFGILLSLDPAVAALAGLFVLREALAPLELAGMALVVGASVLVLVTHPGGRGPAAAFPGATRPPVPAELG